jgi:hypothetical protein
MRTINRTHFAFENKLSALDRAHVRLSRDGYRKMDVLTWERRKKVDKF